MEETSLHYAKTLPDSPGEIYLTNRGITSAAADSFRLGFVANPLPGHENYAGMLSIPYLTRSGVVSIRFRAVPENGDVDAPIQGPKYLTIYGDSMRPFNTLALARRENFAFICEGEFDTITLSILGLPAVGIPGTEHWKPLYRRMFRYRTIIVPADNDDQGAGKEFGKKIQSDIHGTKVILMDKGYDVNKTYVEKGAEYLLNKLGFGEKEEK